MQEVGTRVGGSLDIYQAYFGESQRQQVAPIAVPYDVAGNTANDQREYELFRRIYAARSRDAGPWGLVSGKFELKTMIPLDEFYRFASARLASGFDCVFVNPMIGNEAMHLNVWEQWWVANEDIKTLCGFLETVAPIHSGMPMGYEDFCFCNYFVGTERFWQAYFAYVEQFSEALEHERRRGTPLGQFYGGSASYEKNPDITMRPFIIERLLSSFLSTHPEISRTGYSLAEPVYRAKFGTRMGEILHHLSSVKNRAIAAGDQALFDQWGAMRSELFPLAMKFIWPLDDPLDLTMSPRFRPSLAASMLAPAHAPAAA
jgi:hypothetical protein